MKHGRRVVAIAVLALVAAGAAAVARARSHKPHGPAQAASLSLPQQRTITCNSPSLGGSAPAVVYLPAGYYSGSRRYRVIYFLHGLPANATSYMVNKFVGTAVSSGRDASIVVAPQGARSDNEDHESLDPNYDFNEALTRAHVPHLFRTYPGGHSGALWRGEAMRWLDYALDALARGA